MNLIYAKQENIFFRILLIGFMVMIGSSLAFAQHQQVKLVGKNLRLKAAFAQIEQQTKMFVDYKVQDVNDALVIKNIPKKNDVKTVMEQLLEGLGCSIRFSNGHIIISKISQSVSLPKMNISGMVIDQNGIPVIGANIQEKNTKNGTISDLGGKFTLNVSQGAILVVSYMGFKTKEVNLDSRTSYKIIIEEDSELLNEVVIIGYGSQKKVNLTGAVAQLNGDRLENRSVSNIGQALQGAVANLNVSLTDGGAPGSSPSMNVRGYTGISQDGTMLSNAPLVVIDGVAGGDISTINMNDVENISVLKDAASAAIYGSSAPYGVILVTTKKGKNNQKPTITYSNNFMFSQPINLPEYMNSLDFANIYNEACDNAGMARKFSDETIGRIKNYLDGKITYETVANATTDKWNEWGNGNANNDWFDILFKDVAFSQQHNAGISGGTANSNYYVGVGYFQQNGMYNYANDTYKRYNVRANLTSDITKWLSFSFRSSFARGATDTPYPYEGASGNHGDWMKMIASRNWPTEPLYTPNGSFASENRMAGFADGGRWKTTTDKLTLTGEFVFRPLKGWDITANYTYNGQYSDESKHRKVVSVYRPSGVEEEKYAPSAMERYKVKQQHQVVNLFTSYEKQINEHYFKGMIGFTQELYEYDNLYAHNRDLYSNDIPSLTLTYGESPTTTDDVKELAIRGGFGRINYNYKEKYLIELNGRYDGTSRFLKNNRFKFYPGVSAAWVPSKEAFWKPVENIVNSLKVRGSWGQLGDQSFTSSYYPFYPSLGVTNLSKTNYLFSDGLQPSVNQPSLFNSSLTWVTTSTLDFGVDMSFFSNRLNISFDWYKRKADDFVGPAEKYPAILGTSAPQTNNVSMETKGFEFTIGWKDRIRDFSYGVSAVLSDYRSKVTKYPNPAGLITTWYAGKELGEVWGYETVGFFQSDDEITQSPDQSKLYGSWSPGDIRYADLNNDKKIDWGNNTLEDHGDQKIIANTTPRFSFGVNLNGEYKGFDITIFLQGVAKRDAVFSNTNSWDGTYFWGITGDTYTSMLTTEHYDRWTEENRNGYFPKYYLNDEVKKNTQLQSKYVQNAAYLRVKNIQLGYTFPMDWLRKISCQKLRLFVNVENLATWTGLIKTMDPEFATTDGRVYPLQRTWSCGVNVTF